MQTNYNNTIINSVRDYLRKLFEQVTRYDEQERKIEIVKMDVTSDESNSLYYFINNQKTYEFNMLISYKLLSREGKVLNEDTIELAVPKLINNVFVVEGKLRVPTTTLNNSYECSVYNHEVVTFDWNRKFYIEGDHAYLKIIDEDYNELMLDATEENFEKYKPMLLLSREQELKLKVLIDTSEDIPAITEALCWEMIELEDTKDSDSIILKEFVNVEQSLLKYLNRGNVRKDILRRMRSKLYQYGSVYITDVQNYITKYFRIANEASVDIPQNVNPLVYNTLSSKIVVPPYVAYNETFTDLIDPVNTPENQNINKLNELNVCCSIDDGRVMMSCYKFPSFEPLKLPYLEYVNSIVICNDTVDYDKKTVDLNGAYYKLRLKRHPLTSRELSSSDILIEPKPDEKLSETTRQIPLINMSDTVRVAMGSGMIKQAVELENAEEPLVSSGNERDIDNSDTTRVVYKGKPGKVMKISDRSIIVKVEDGSVIPYEIPETSIGLNNTIISYSLSVREGDKMSDGDTLARSFVTRDKSYKLGVNAKCAYMYYKGFNHEDAIIISESFAKKMTSYQIVDVHAQILYDDEVRSIIPIGSEVSSRDILLNRMSFIPMYESTKKAYDIPIMQFMRLDRYANNVICPNNIKRGIVIDTAIDINPNWREVINANDASWDENSTKAIIEALEGFERNKNSKKKIVADVPERYWSMKVQPQSAEEADGQIASISIRVLKISKASQGTKLCNRWGSKGEVSLVLPDSQMPRNSKGEPFDMLLNPPSVIKRKNPSQLIEVLLAKCANRIFELCKKEQKFEDAKELLVKYMPEYANVDDNTLIRMLKQSKNPFSFKVGSYSKFGRKEVLALAEELGVSETEYVTDPDPEIGELENPVITGDSYYFRLYHNADYTAKVTSSAIRENREPLLGTGTYRPEGQKIGEMENWALMAHGTDHLFKPDALEKEGVFLNELMLAGYYIDVDNRLALLADNQK